MLTREQVLQYGASGPIARASGVDMDLRRDDPYLAYGDLQGVLRVPTRQTGDCFARFEVLREQIHVSLDLADACLDRLDSLPPGPINTRLPKVLKAPEGHTYAWTENPLGINGYFLVSKGEKTPWRLKLRSASFNNVQVLKEMLPGQLVAGHGRDPRLDVLRRRRRRQVAVECTPRGHLQLSSAHHVGRARQVTCALGGRTCPRQCALGG